MHPRTIPMLSILPTLSINVGVLSCVVLMVFTPQPLSPISTSTMIRILIILCKSNFQHWIIIYFWVTEIYFLFLLWRINVFTYIMTKHYSFVKSMRDVCSNLSHSSNDKCLVKVTPFNKLSKLK